MNSPILSACNLSHHPRWIEVDVNNGWYRYICSNCGESARERGNKTLPSICPNCKEKMQR